MQNPNPNPRSWIRPDETAGDLLGRVAVDRPSLLLPPLHRVPLRPGNVVEVAGPSPSAKSEVLLQAAVQCVLPKERDGVHFGGMERGVVYFDLDCRFDVVRFGWCLKRRLDHARGIHNASHRYDAKSDPSVFVNDDLFLSCMRRFLYIRCYDSHEFLVALKKVCHQFLKGKESCAAAVLFLMIDSIGAFYWMDRSYQPFPSGDMNRKTMSLQSITDAVTQEIRKLLQAHPMLVLATKTIMSGHETSENEAQRHSHKPTSEEGAASHASDKETDKHFYREYMPLAWQLLVTHRVFLRTTGEFISKGDDGEFCVHTSQWVLPSLAHSDRFIIRDAGVVMIS